MSRVSKKPDIYKPPFYFFRGKGWKIETKIKVDGKMMKFSRCWYRTEREAKDDYEPQRQAFLLKHSHKEEQREQITWGEFVERFIDFRRTQVRGSTLVADRYRINVIFEPLFNGKLAKDCFKRDAAYKVQTKVKNWKANRKNKNKALSYYLSMLEYAAKHRYLESGEDRYDCEAEIMMFKSTEQDEIVSEKTILTSEQLNALIDVIDEAHDKMLTMLMAQTGLRIGEAVVLRVCDFDFAKRELSVSRTASVDEFGQRREFNRTKTELGMRTIPLTEQFAAVVASYCNAFRYFGTDLLFPPLNDRSSSATMDTTMYRKRLSRYCAQAGVPRITPHSLRHTFCTMLSERCVTDADRIARSYIMGHSVAVDESIYAAHNQLMNAKKLIKD